MGFEFPSPVQEEAIPKTLAGQNIIAKAKNGTGKTAAYAIPLIQRLDVSLNKIQALVLVPTRELAMQTSLVIKNLSKHKKIECMVSTGGTLVREDFHRLQQTVHVIVATPGRILDLANKEVANLDACGMLVLDEVDKLLSSDFKESVERII
jgi:ATP-dependent RNA helicase DDX6/DHH1